MRVLAILCVLMGSGCRTMPSGWVVTGSAYVETERPDGKAVAKVEVQYRPPVPASRESLVAEPRPAPTTGVSLGAPVELASHSRSPRPQRSD